MEQPKPGSGERVERPLGRGLEHVSRVFLTQPPERFTGPRGDEPPSRPPPTEQPAAAGTLLLRPAEQVSRETVGAALKEFAGSLEEGLGLVDGSIPCGACGEIDFLAVDRRNQLAVIDFDITAVDDLLVRGLAQVNWMIENVPNLRRMFRGNAINFSLPPRLFLLAPQFSSRARSAAHRIATPDIRWVRYHLVETPGRAGIFFEHLPAE